MRHDSVFSGVSFLAESWAGMSFNQNTEILCPHENLRKCPSAKPWKLEFTKTNPEILQAELVGLALTFECQSYTVGNKSTPLELKPKTKYRNSIHHENLRKRPSAKSLTQKNSSHAINFELTFILKPGIEASNSLRVWAFEPPCPTGRHNLGWGELLLLLPPDKLDTAPLATLDPSPFTSERYIYICHN